MRRWLRERDQAALGCGHRVDALGAGDNTVVRYQAMKLQLVRLALVLALSACTTPPVEREPIPITPAKDRGAAVVRREIPAPITPVTPAPPPTAAPAIASIAPKAPPVQPIVIPPHVQYVCVSERNGERRQTTIEFVPKVAELCRKHPE